MEVVGFPTSTQPTSDRTHTRGFSLHIGGLRQQEGVVGAYLCDQAGNATGHPKGDSD